MPMAVNGDIYHGGYLLHIKSGADSRFYLPVNRGCYIEHTTVVNEQPKTPY
jgi:hypothetical protein